MLKKLSKMVQFYYFSVLLLVLLGFGYGIYFYWEAGFFNFNFITTIQEASFWSGHIKENKDIEDLQKSLNKADIKKAIKWQESLEANLIKLEGLKNLKADFKEYKKESENLKGKMNSLLSHAEPSSLINVLTKKIDTFYDFVSTNNWKTLTRMGTRIKSKAQSTDHQSYYALKNLHRFLIQDISIMKNVTETSVLGSSEKSLIESKLNSLLVEVNMLEKYLNGLEVLFKDFERYKKAYEQLLKSIAPKISLEKMSIQETNQTIILGASALFGATFVLMLLGIWVYFINERKSFLRVEQYILDCIKGDILSKKINVHPSHTDFFKGEVNKMHDYVQKRMGFSNIFQNSLPFATFLLDADLKVVWGNQLFFDVFQLHGQAEDMRNLTWDFLLRFTNFGGEDPIVDAIKNDLAGIFQIKIQSDTNRPKKPYELYVSPVVYNDQKWIMLFLYPLSYLEETINNQAKSIITPINRTLDALIMNQFDQDTTERLKKEYESADINNIYDKFITFNNIVKSHKYGLLNEIDRIENDLNDYHKIIIDISKEKDKYKNLQATLSEDLNHLKEYIIELFELGKEYGQITQKQNQQNLQVNKKVKSILLSLQNLYEKICSSSSSLTKIVSLKKEVKEVIYSLQNSKGRLLQSIDQSLIFQRSMDMDPGKIEVSLTKIKNNVKGLDKSLNEIEKILTLFDIQISKTQMVLEGGEIMVNDEVMRNYHNDLMHNEKTLDSSFYLDSQLEQKVLLLEEKVVHNIQNIYEKQREMANREVVVERLIGEVVSNNIRIRDKNLLEMEMTPQ